MYAPVHEVLSYLKLSPTNNCKNNSEAGEKKISLITNICPYEYTN